MDAPPARAGADADAGDAPAGPGGDSLAARRGEEQGDGLLPAVSGTRRARFRRDALAGNLSARVGSDLALDDRSGPTVSGQGRGRDWQDRVVQKSPLNRGSLDSYDQLDDAFHDRWGPEGDFGRRLLLNPIIFRLIGELAGKRILDAGCGNGYLSRLMAGAGAAVVGVEPAAGPLRYARRKEEEDPVGVTYLRRDLSRLGDAGGPYDAVVANMVFLDIPDWRPALANCVDALAPGGLLVYSLTHPVWVPGHFAEWAQKGYVEIREYLNECEQHGGVAVSFHRPLSAYLNETIRLGCAITQVVEPRLEPGQVEQPQHEILTRLPNFIVIAARRS